MRKIKKILNSIVGWTLVIAVFLFTIGFVIGVCKIAWYGLGL